MKATRIIFMIVLSIISCTYAQVGKSCTVGYTGIGGVCKLSSDCPIVEKQADQGIRPTLCGLGFNSLPIVCCQDTGAPSIQPNENSFLNEEFSSSAPDTFIYPEENEQETPGLSLSERKCNEYSREISGEVSILPLIAGAVATNFDTTKCDFNGVALIVGGTPALLGEFPFMAAIGFRDSDGQILWNCGGTLISEKYVMTAAHCSNTRSFGPPVKVRLGDLDLKRKDDGATPIDVDIDQILKHPEYRTTQKYNDIALMKLKRTITLTKLIRPACLWTKPGLQESTAIATGWGKTDQAGETSDKLLKVILNVYPKSTCDKTYGKNKNLVSGIVDSMLCAGELRGGKDTCQGDSGGPLFVTKEGNQCIFYIIGITSFGRNCAARDTPAVYTKVSSYIPWIEQTVWG